MKKVILATAVTMGMLSCAFGATVTAQSGPYLSVLGGWSFADSPTTSDLSASGKTNDNYTWGGTVGYDFALNQNWLAGAEVSYINFGKNRYDNVGTTNIAGTNINGGTVDIKNQGVQLMATGTYLASNGFNLFAKAGAIRQKTATPAGNQLEWLPAAAAGVGYMITQNWDVALQYERTFGSSWDTANPNSIGNPMSQNAVTLGLTYKFGV